MNHFPALWNLPLTPCRLLPIVPPAMNTKIGFLLCGLALVVPASEGLGVAESAPDRTTGRVLLLEGDRALEGQIQREGEDYLIRRAVGELWVSGDKVRRLCAGWQEAYAYVRSQANLGDPDERLRLARWCQLHGLRKEALAEATAAAQLRPADAEARRLQGLLRRALVSGKPSKPVRSCGDVAPAKRALTPVDLNADAMGGFTTRVQPILMNACAACHAGNRSGSFQLLRAYPGGSLSRRATQYNLAAVVAQIDRERPHLSPLLIKAISIHGGANQAPLKGRQAVAFRNLDDWVEKTLADNPQLQEEPARASADRSAGKAPTVRSKRPVIHDPTEEVGSYQLAVPVNPAEAGAPSVVAMTGPTPAGREAGAGQPKARPQSAPKPPPVPPRDPFDPVIFNGEMHPDK